VNSKHIPPSELILTEKGRIYHLDLAPGEIAHTIITVGDPDRVAQVSKRFDSLEVQRQHREFHTHTGYCNGKRLSVISTGIGPDNIDIVLNELDALVNIDFTSRSVKKSLTTLELVRVGTSGALQPEIPLGSFVASEIGLGFDNLIHFYENDTAFVDETFSEAFVTHTQWNPKNSRPYALTADASLAERFRSMEMIFGITATNVGFYGPQGRMLRVPLFDSQLNDKIASFEYQGKKITNLEMETSAIYAMAALLGHRALSLNAIIANRALATFSDQPKKVVDRLIEHTLNVLTS
jgi:uridine phosphorylase